MRAQQNRTRIATLQATETQRLQADVRSRMDEARATRYTPYDDAGSNAASLAMMLVRDALEARLEQTFYARFGDDRNLLPVMELCAPKPLTYDETSLARGFFAAYAQAAMTCATTLQLSQWVEGYRARMAGRDAWAVDGLCRETLRGLAQLRGYLASLGARDKTDKADAAYDALLTTYATRMAQAAASRAWHVLSDATRATVRDGKRTRLERKIARSHRTRAMRRHNGLLA